jgi:hypothetical protein
MPKGDEQTATRTGTAVLLVKFFFTNSTLVPQGLRMVDPDGVHGTTLKLGRDRVHAIMARKSGAAELGEVGRVRDGRVDTGNNMLKEDGTRISVAKLMSEIQAAGFKLLDAHYIVQTKVKNGRQTTKYVVVLSFGIGEAIKLGHTTLEGIQGLAATTWGNVHGWDNSATEGVNTLNLVGRLPDQKPSKRVALIDGELEVINIAP